MNDIKPTQITTGCWLCFVSLLISCCGVDVPTKCPCIQRFSRKPVAPLGSVGTFRQGPLCELETNMVYIASSSSARAFIVKSYPKQNKTRQDKRQVLLSRRKLGHWGSTSKGGIGTLTPSCLSPCFMVSMREVAFPMYSCHDGLCCHRPKGNWSQMAVGWNH